MAKAPPVPCLIPFIIHSEYTHGQPNENTLSQLIVKALVPCLTQFTFINHSEYTKGQHKNYRLLPKNGSLSYLCTQG